MLYFKKYASASRDFKFGRRMIRVKLIRSAYPEDLILDTTIEADVVPQENYDVSITKSFATEAEAVTFLKTQAGISTT